MSDYLLSSQPSRLAMIPQTNMPSEIPLDQYSPSMRDELAQTCLWLASQEQGLRIQELQKGAHRLTYDNRECLRRMYLSLLLEDVADVQRQVETARDAAVKYESEKY